MQGLSLYPSRQVMSTPPGHGVGTRSREEAVEAVGWREPIGGLCIAVGSDYTSQTGKTRADDDRVALSQSRQ